MQRPKRPRKNASAGAWEIYWKQMELWEQSRNQSRAPKKQSDRSGNVKSRYNEDKMGGYTDTYFGGVGVPDGPGHGHIRLNDQGEAIVIRDAYEPGEPNARRDATLRDTRG